MNRGAWRAISPWGSKGSDTTERLTLSLYYQLGIKASEAEDTAKYGGEHCLTVRQYLFFCCFILILLHVHIFYVSVLLHQVGCKQFDYTNDTFNDFFPGYHPK